MLAWPNGLRAALVLAIECTEAVGAGSKEVGGRDARGSQRAKRANGLRERGNSETVGNAGMQGIEPGGATKLGQTNVGVSMQSDGLCNPTSFAFALPHDAVLRPLAPIKMPSDGSKLRAQGMSVGVGLPVGIL